MTPWRPESYAFLQNPRVKVIINTSWFSVCKRSFLLSRAYEESRDKRDSSALDLSWHCKFAIPSGFMCIWALGAILYTAWQQNNPWNMWWQHHNVPFSLKTAVWNIIKGKLPTRWLFYSTTEFSVQQNNIRG